MKNIVTQLCSVCAVNPVIVGSDTLCSSCQSNERYVWMPEPGQNIALRIFAGVAVLVVSFLGVLPRFKK